MNLQRQKVWSNSQNAKLELEVEALQRQLAALNELEKEEGQNSSLGIYPTKEVFDASKVEQGKKIHQNTIGQSPSKSSTKIVHDVDFVTTFISLFISEIADHVIHKIGENFFKLNYYKIKKVERLTLAISVDDRPFREERKLIGIGTREKETIQELLESKESKREQLISRPRVGRRTVKNTDEHAGCDKANHQVCEYNFDHGRVAHRTHIDHDAPRDDGTKEAKSIRRRMEEFSTMSLDMNRKPEVRSPVLKIDSFR